MICSVVTKHVPSCTQDWEEEERKRSVASGTKAHARAALTHFAARPHDENLVNQKTLSPSPFLCVHLTAPLSLPLSFHLHVALLCNIHVPQPVTSSLLISY